MVLGMETAALVLLLCLARGGAQTDNRCFLDGGGSTDSFFVREDLAVNSVLGKLRVIGDVGRDILLTLSDPGTSPISIDASGGAASLVLTSPLDKEGILGPSSLTVGVVCERLGTRDPGFTIPISIRVTDVNDNAPMFLGAPYMLNVSELSLVGSLLHSDVLAKDADQAGPFSTVEYNIPAGPFSEYLAIENPLEGKIILTKSLDFETLQLFSVKLVAQDQGSPPQYNETTIVINVLDADDQNPAFYFERYSAILPSAPTRGSKLQVEPQDVQAFDKDIGINSPVYYSFSGQGDDYMHFELNRNTGQIYIKGDIPDSKFRQPATLIVRATQFDNPDRYAVTTLSVSRGGVFHGSLSFDRSSYSSNVLENMPLNSVILTVITNRQSDKRVQYYIEEGDLPGHEFSIGSSGDLTLRKTLDYETRESFSFRVVATDGRQNDTTRVNITVININDWDPRFRFPLYEFFVDEGHAEREHKVGAVTVHDGDKGDKISLHLSGPYARVFRITSKGDIVIDNLRYMNGSSAHLVVVAEDSGVPPRRASVPVVVRFAESIASSRVEEKTPNWLMLWILALVLVVSLIIIVCLGVYICKHKRTFSSAPSKPPAASQSANYHQQFQTGPAQASQHPPREDLRRSPPTQEVPRPQSVASNKSEVTTASSVVSNIPSRPSNGPIYNPLNPRSGSQRYQKHRAKVAPHPGGPQPAPSIHESGLPTVPIPHVANGSTRSLGLPRSASASDLGSEVSSLQAQLRQTIMGSQQHLRRVEWPRASIPRRVKKLSWEDELAQYNSQDREISTYLDPNVSVTPMAESHRSMGDTVYF